MRVSPDARSRVRRGGMGLVYLCESPDGDRVAVKRLANALAADSDVTNAFLRECQYWILLGNNPNVGVRSGPSKPRRSHHDRRQPCPRLNARRDNNVGIAPGRMIAIWADLCAGLGTRATGSKVSRTATLSRRTSHRGDGTAKITTSGLPCRSIRADGIRSGGRHLGNEPSMAGPTMYMAPEQVTATPEQASDIYASAASCTRSSPGQPAYGRDRRRRTICAPPLPHPATRAASAQRAEAPTRSVMACLAKRIPTPSSTAGPRRRHPRLMPPH